MPNLVLIRGVSGSGKSTFAFKILQGNAVHYEADMYFCNDDGEGQYVFDPNKLHAAHQWCQNSVKVIMATVREDIVVSNTFTTEKELKPYIDLAKEYGYTVTTVVVENRNNTESIHDVPQEIRQRQADRLKNSIKLL